MLAYTEEIFQILKGILQIHGLRSNSRPDLIDLKNSLVPLIAKFVSVVKNAQGEVVGFGICLPSLSKAIQNQRTDVPSVYLPLKSVEVLR